MDLSDIRAYTERDWTLLSELDDRLWSEQLASAGPGALVYAIDAVRRFIRAVRPDWPGDDARAEDLAHHIHLAMVVRRVRF
jgi:hypothetical protein